MSKPANQPDQKQQRDPQSGPKDSQLPPQQGGNKDQAPSKDRTDTDGEESPRMNEGDGAPSVRRGALNTQYDGDKAQAGKPGAAPGGPDDRSIDKERSTGDERDTLANPRGVKQP